MKILSHRGYWKSGEEKNSEAAFIRSFKLGFGIETDVRDHNGRLVISHDPPQGNPFPAERLWEIYKQHGDGLPLALNIKADGLQHLLQENLNQFQIENYFVFDMSIPDTLPYLRSGMPFFTRISEYESTPSFYQESAGIWLDCFKEEWMDQADIMQPLEEGKKVCLVSPELHQREHEKFWSNLMIWGLLKNENFMICTDYPEAARSFFYG